VDSDEFLAGFLLMVCLMPVLGILVLMGVDVNGGVPGVPCEDWSSYFNHFDTWPGKRH
jgi:hypothetical protein